MAWQIRANYGVVPPRWLNIDEQGFYTTSQGRAKVFDTRAEAVKVLAQVRKASPAVSFEAIEVST